MASPSSGPEFAGVSRICVATRHANGGLDFGCEKLPAYLNSPVRHVVERRVKYRPQRCLDIDQAGYRMDIIK